MIKVEQPESENQNQQKIQWPSPQVVVLIYAYSQKYHVTFHLNLMQPFLGYTNI